MVYSLEQRIFIVLEFYRLNRSPMATRRSFQQKFNVPKGPDPTTIRTLFAKFERTGSVEDACVGNVGRHRSAVTDENVQVVHKIIARSPRKSIRRTANEAGMKRTSTHKILKHSLHLFPYKIQTHQPLSVSALQQREAFANNMLQMIDVRDIDVESIWFSDEAHFHLDGFVNKQNWRIWGTEKPHVSLERPLHPKRVTVWAALSSRGIIGPFFIRQTINSSRYITLLHQFVAVNHALEDPQQTSWFMQDGARPHRTPAVFEFLEEHFDNRVLALYYCNATGKGIDWPPYSPDLNPCDFFLWGTLKDKVYSRNPTTLEELEQFVTDECVSISVDTLEKVITNFTLRLRHVIAATGGHFENIVL